jgi:hypothetical protein
VGDYSETNQSYMSMTHWDTGERVAYSDHQIVVLNYSPFMKATADCGLPDLLYQRNC